jgi:alpha-galactosidase
VVVLDGKPGSVSTAGRAPQQVARRQVQDAHGAGDELEVTYPAQRGLVLTVRFRLYQDQPFALFQVELTNQSDLTVRVRHFFFQTVPEGLRPAVPPIGFYHTGWQSWSPAGFLPRDARQFRPILPIRKLQGPMIWNHGTPWEGRPSRFWSESVGVVVTAREVLVAGGASLADQFVQVGVDLRPDRQRLVIQSQGDGAPLDPGQAATSEWFYLEWVTRPSAHPLGNYARTVARHMGVGALRPIPVGWCSWYIYGAGVREADVIQNLASAALLSDELPLQIIQLDQGYERTWGDWTDRNPDFPHALDWLADRIEGSDFTPGLWLAPFTLHPRSQVAQEHPDWLLRDRRGRAVSAGLLLSFIGRVLDPTHPEVLDHVYGLIETATHDWGYRYLKLDFLYAAALPGVRHNPRLTRAQAYREALKTIREAAGEETFLVGCGAPIGPSIGLVDAMRIGPDTGPEWGPHFKGLRRLLRGNPCLPSLRNSVRNTATRGWMHRHWWINDPDTLMVRDSKTALSEDEVLSQLTLVALSGGLPILSDDLSTLSPERRAMAAALLPPLLERPRVLDLLRSRMPEQVVTPVSRSWGEWQLVGLFNWSEEQVERAVPHELVPEARQGEAFHLFDFWNRRHMRLEPGSPLPRFTLPPHGSVLLSLRPIIAGPHLVATTLHVSQGGEGTAWVTGTRSVAFSISLGRMAQGEIWIALPARPTEAAWNGAPLEASAVHAVASGIWSVTTSVNREGVLEVTW